MADRFPLILNTSNNQIQEIASGDQLDLTGNNIANAGIITAGNVTIGAATTDLIVTGDARVTGILTVGTGSLTLDGPNNLVNVGTALTLGHTQGLQFHTQNLHSAGFEVNQINVSGASTMGDDATFTGASSKDMVWDSSAGALDFADNTIIRMGNNDDMLLFHDGTSSRLTDSYGALFIGSNYIALKNQALNETYISCIANGAVTIKHDNNTKLETTSSGVAITGDGTFSGNVSVGGTLTYEDVTNIDSVGIITAREGVFLPDLKQLKLGNTAAAPDLYLWHNSSTGNSNISNKTGDLFIQGNNGSGTVVNQIAVKSNASVELNYQGNKKFETTGSGVNISGNLITNHSNGAIVNNGWGFLRQRFDTANYDSIKWQNAAASVDFCDIGYDIDTSTSPNSGILRLKGYGSKGRVLIIAGSVVIQFEEDRQISGVGNILPYTDSQYNIGSNSIRFANVYADTLYGDGSNLTGIASPAITAINNATNNYVVTSEGGTTVNAEPHLRFNGTHLAVGNIAPGQHYYSRGIACHADGTGSVLHLTDSNSGSGQDNGFDIISHDNSAYIWQRETANIIFGVGGNTKWNMDNDGRFYPNGNGNQDIGKSTNRVQNIYTSDLHLSNEAKGANDVDGTWGDYTIQEGESDLFLINNRSGKKYKFNLTEVS